MASRPKEKDMPVEEKQTDTLKQFCGSDGEMYEALSNFLLLNARDQEKSIGGVSQSIEQGMTDLAEGYKLRARLKFENAARLSLYHQDRANAEKALKLAEAATEETSEPRHRMHRTLLTNLDRTLDIARQYYGHLYAKSLSKEKERDESKMPKFAPILVRK